MKVKKKKIWFLRRFFINSDCIFYGLSWWALMKQVVRHISSKVFRPINVRLFQHRLECSLTFSSRPFLPLAFFLQIFLPEKLRRNVRSVSFTFLNCIYLFFTFSFEFVFILNLEVFSSISIYLYCLSNCNFYRDRRRVFAILVVYNIYSKVSKQSAH